MKSSPQIWRILRASIAVVAVSGFASAQETPSPAGANPATTREAQLEARIRQLEALIARMPDPAQVRALESKIQNLPDPRYVHQLEDRLQRLSSKVDELSKRPSPVTNRPEKPQPPSVANDPAALPPALPPELTGIGDNSGVGDELIGGPAGLSPSAAPPSSRFSMPAPVPSFPLLGRFGPGFELKTDDDEYSLQFHDLTQTDGRFYGNANQKPVSDSLTLARQWFIFSGWVTRPIEYYLSIANAFDTLEMLDVYVNLNYDKRLQFRFGRYKTPFMYEFYAEPTQAIPNGEWSLFLNNFGMDRDVGFMAWGQLLDDRLDYAIGIFDSVPNGYVDLSNPKDGIAYMNFAPWANRPDSILENFNIGGSAVFGDQNHAPVPQTLRTIVPTSGSSVIGVPFLSLNNNVIARGQRDLWDLHVAYYYRQLALIAEWQGGFENLALATQSRSTPLPIQSFYVQAAYMLTGERVASRGMVKPLRPFDLRPGRFGLGAWELVGRVNPLEIGNQVFSEGFANPNLWTNRLVTTDLGIGWYMTQYFKVLFDWQHAAFGSPVQYRPDALQKSSDLFMVRFQLWF